MNIKISLEDDLARYVFTEGKKKIMYKDMTREQQIKVCNAFAQGYNLYAKFIKEQ